MQNSKLQDFLNVYETTHDLIIELDEEASSKGNLSKELRVLIGLGIILYDMAPAITQLKKELDEVNHKLNNLIN